MWIQLSVALILVALVVVGPPLALHTSVYPVAVVNGNSMFPVLKNGELVVFRGVSDPDNIPNGTIIVFVEGDAPISALNYLVRPVVIHEVIGRIVNQYGRVYYETKGVNNPYPDPGLVPAQNVVGTPVLEAPYAGFVLLFFSSPEGLVALIGVFLVAYVEVDARFRERVKTNRGRFLVPFVFFNREGKLSDQALLHLNYVAEHAEELAQTALTDEVVQWLSSNLEKRWDFRVSKCGKHGDDAAEFFGRGIPTLKMCVREIEAKWGAEDTKSGGPQGVSGGSEGADTAKRGAN